MSFSRDRYALVRMTAEKPVVHRWLALREDHYTLRTPCGITDAERRAYVMVARFNLNPSLPLCRRCHR